jgi:hypothetical protein
MTTTLSLRRLWTIYKRTSVVGGTGRKRDVAITQLAFYTLELGDLEELLETIRHQGRQIEKIRGRCLRSRRH